MHDKWRILASVDLRADADAQVQHALNVAEAVRGNLTMLYLRNDRSDGSEPVQWPAIAEAADRDLDVRRVVVAGSIKGMFGRYADDLGADLITVTTDNRWWQRWWRKSAAAAVATSTDRPICFTNVKWTAPAVRVKSILSVLSLDGTDEAVLRFSEELADRCDATLVFLHVLPEVSEALLAYGLTAAGDRPLSREVAEQRMTELMHDVSRPHLTAITTGSAYRSIATLAKEHEADLVITSRRNGALSDFDAGALLSRVTCPVISVPAGSGPLGSRAVHRYRRSLKLTGAQRL